jgi:hypothetical protein
MAAALGYAAEMRHIDEDIAKTDGVVCSTPPDPERVTRHIYRLYQKASISGDLAGLTAVERSIDEAIIVLANPGDLYLLKAHATFKLHKLAEVGAALRAVPSVYDSDEDGSSGRISTFHGRYRQQLCRLRHERSGALSLVWRISGARWAMQPVPTIFTKKQDQLTARRCALTHGSKCTAALDFTRGRTASTVTQYHAAYPGCWLVDEHIAELGAGGRIRRSRCDVSVDRP